MPSIGSSEIYTSLEVGTPVSTNNTDLFAVDMNQFSSACVQITGTFVATYRFEFSNNEAFSPVATGYAINISSTSNQLAQTGNGVGMYLVPRFGRYFRVRTTAYTSGTINSVYYLTTQPITFPTYAAVSSAISVDTEMPTAAALSDTISRTLSTPTVGAALLGDNGTNLLRLRTALGAETGLGRLNVASGTGIITLLNSVSAPSTGASVNLGSAYDRMGFQVITASGTITSATIRVEASINGTHWGTAYQFDFAPNNALIPYGVFSFVFIRAVLVSISGGGSITLLACSSG